MKPMEYLLGYSMALIPIAVLQSILFFISGMAFNLNFDINVIYSILVLIPISILFITLGILIGCISSDTQAPTIGSLFIQVVSFTSGMWFSIDMVGKVYKFICEVLPFSHSISLIRNILLGTNQNIFISIIIILIYTLVIFISSSLIFRKKMFSDNK
jgi:ABC-2 type transport system permease protein